MPPYRRRATSGGVNRCCSSATAAGANRKTAYSRIPPATPATRPGRSCGVSAGPGGRRAATASNAGAWRPTFGASATPAHVASAQRAALCARLASNSTDKGAGSVGISRKSWGSTVTVRTTTPSMPATHRRRPSRRRGT